MNNGTLWQKTVAFVLSVIFWLFVYKIGHAANSNTSLFPTRIVFDNSGNTIKEFTVTNSGSEAARCVLSMIDMRMKEDGKLEVIPESAAGVTSAGNMSLYGDINVSYIDSSGKPTYVGAMKRYCDIYPIGREFLP